VAPPAQVDALALEALLSRTALGDRAAFASLYQATSPKLYGVALRILRREDWAEEVLQECYVNVWRHAPEYNASRAAPMTWMTSIVRNRCLDWLRRPNPLPLADLGDEGAEEAIVSDRPGPLDELERGRESGAIARCLRALEAKQRQAIALAFYDGLSHAELAEHLREPLGTVKTWVRRGLLKLKTCLAEQP
jgi:RNA polymerase sigma-70 factor (ECF subfamily)